MKLSHPPVEKAEIKLYPFQQYTLDRFHDVRSVLIGDEVEPGKLYGLPIESFVRKIALSEMGCWIWTGALGGSGFYGTFAWRYELNGYKRKQQRPAHIITYMIYHGLYPRHYQIDHWCRIHSCVCPDHLEAVTPGENQRRGNNGDLKTQCVNGHPYTEDNIYYDKRRGFRECRKCRYDAVQRYREVM